MQPQISARCKQIQKNPVYFSGFSLAYTRLVAFTYYLTSNGNTGLKELIFQR